MPRGCNHAFLFFASFVHASAHRVASEKMSGIESDELKTAGGVVNNSTANDVGGTWTSMSGTDAPASRGPFFVDRGSCPKNHWTVPSNGRSKRTGSNYGCCKACPGELCYNDCSCQCESRWSCDQLEKGHCILGANCVWSDSGCTVAGVFPTSAPGDSGPQDLANQIQVMGEKVAGHTYYSPYQAKFALWCKAHNLHAGVWMSYTKYFYGALEGASWDSVSQWTQCLLGYAECDKDGLQAVAATATQNSSGFVRLSDYEGVVKLLHAHGVPLNAEANGAYSLALWITSRCIEPDDFMNVLKSHIVGELAVQKTLEDMQMVRGNEANDKKCYASADELNCYYASWSCDGTPTKTTQKSGARPSAIAGGILVLAGSMALLQ